MGPRTGTKADRNCGRRTTARRRGRSAPAPPRPRRSAPRRSAGTALLLLALLAGGLRASLADDPHFERVGAEASPLPAIVTTIYEDRSGLIWLGSREGLTMYDGYAFTLFEHDAADPSSISDNAIRTLFEDRRGNLWAGTNTGGLNRLDLATRSFQHFRYNADDPSSLSYDSVYAIVRTGREPWVGTQRGSTGSIRQREIPEVPGRAGRHGAIGSDYVTCLWWIARDGSGSDGRGGPCRSRTGGGRLHGPQAQRGRPGSLGETASIAAGGRIGRPVGGNNSGLDRLDPDTGRFRHFRHDAGIPPA